MPANVTETVSFPSAVVGPAGGDARTATGVRTMGGHLASRTLWLKAQLDALFGGFHKVEAVSAASDTLTITAHGLATNDVVYIAAIGGSVPPPLFAGIALYVIKIDDDTIKLAGTSGGAAIDLSGSGSGDIYVFKATSALDAFVTKGFTTLKGDTIPPATLRVILAAYFVPTQGATLTGEITHLGDSATVARRVGYLTDADQTIDPATKDVWYCQDVTGNRIVTLNAPAKEGLRVRFARISYANAFAAVFKRAADASTVARLNAVGGFDLESITLAGVTKWHAVGFGGADQIS